MEVIDNIKKFARYTEYEIICTLDVDDEPTVAIKDQLSRMDKVTTFFGRSKNKINAINRDMDKIGPWDILFNVSDDQLFLVEGFDEIVMAKVNEVGGDCFLHYPDGNAKARLATMSIMDKKYYDRTGYIYHPSYISLWCDNEAMEVAKRLGRYFYTNLMIFDHYHPAFGKGVRDEQYKRTEAFYQLDKKNFDRRKTMNFRK